MVCKPASISAALLLNSPGHPEQPARDFEISAELRQSQAGCGLVTEVVCIWSMHVYRPHFYPVIAPGYPQPTNATRKKWFRCDLHFLAGCRPATSAAQRRMPDG